MSKHTPGPWEWWTSNSFRRLSATGDGDVLYGAAHRDGVATVVVSDANARLIAAAPELYDELADAIPDLEIPGHVARIRPIGEDKRGDITYTVTVRPDKADERLRWNMTTAVFIEPSDGQGLAEAH